MARRMTRTGTSICPPGPTWRSRMHRRRRKRWLAAQAAERRATGARTGRRPDAFCAAAERRWSGAVRSRAADGPARPPSGAQLSAAGRRTEGTSHVSIPVCIAERRPACPQGRGEALAGAIFRIEAVAAAGRSGCGRPPPARPQAVPHAPATASNASRIRHPGDEGPASGRCGGLAAAEGAPPQAEMDGAGWVPARAQHGYAPLNSYGHPIKTTIRLTHAQARAVKLAALVLDRPQQEILTAGLLGG